MRTKDTLSHSVVCAQSENVREKLSCEVYLSTLLGCVYVTKSPVCNEEEQLTSTSSTPVKWESVRQKSLELAAVKRM